jgi:RimJ/RimL family protein N-acetyltransferase
MPRFSFSTRDTSLRAFEPADAAELQVYLNHPDLAGRRYLPDGVSDLAPLSMRQVEGVIERWQKEDKSWTLAIVDAASGAVLGHTRADWEWDPHCPWVSVAVAPSHQRRGIGSAALAMALRFLFEETPAHVVSGWMSSWNEPAIAFAAKNGFSKAVRRPRAGVHAGAYYSEVAFDLLRREWMSREVTRHAA